MNTLQTPFEAFLRHINPALLDYTQWVNVGMGLKHEGFPCSVWSDWSARDAERFKPGECEMKWEGFHGSNKPVTKATIIKFAQDQGWKPPPAEPMDWNSVIGEDPAYEYFCSSTWELEQESAEPEWNPAQQIITYLKTLFRGDERVGFVMTANDDGHPDAKGCYNRTAREIVADLQKYSHDISFAIGTLHPTAGAWIRFNPLDGKGVCNNNVTDYRFALVESDEETIERQRQIYDELKLPIAALVHSGNKSLHAIVRIDATDKDEYRERVDYLYDICEKRGLKIDRQNKNPARLSRMPGVMRGDQRQSLVDVNTGKKNWDAWRKWIERKDEPKEPLFPIISMAELDAMDCTTKFLCEDVLAADQPGIVGGGHKCFKTTTALDLSVCLASARNYLDRFVVPEPVRVCYFSGEGGKGVLQDSLRRIAKRRGFDRLTDVPNLFVTTKVPRLDNIEHLAELKKYINMHAPDVVFVDPTYLAISGEGVSNVFSMGERLGRLTDLCLPMGVTPILVHHYRKNRLDAFKPPELDELSQSGFAEYAGQWILLGKREAYNKEAAWQKLWMNVGGRTGHGDLYGYDIAEGSNKDPEGRHWETSILRQSEIIEGRKDDAAQRRAEKQATELATRQADASELFNWALKQTGGFTEKMLRARSSDTRASRALAAWQDADPPLVEEHAVPRPCGKGVKDYPGFIATKLKEEIPILVAVESTPATPAITD